MLKRSGFSKPTLEKVIASRSKPRKALERATMPKVKRKGASKVKVHWKPPAWFMAIPVGSHGSNPVQKRLWKLTSDYVRIFDAEKYGVCASCPNRIENWQNGDCGHYKGWTSCHNYFKFNRINLSWQCNYCNRLSDGSIGYRFSETLKMRHGNTILDDIEKINNIHHGGKFDDFKLVEMARGLLMDFEMGTVQKPPYYETVLEKFSTP